MNTPTFDDSSRSTRLALLRISQPVTKFVPTITDEPVQSSLWGHMWLAVTETTIGKPHIDAVEILGVSLTGPGVFEGDRYTRRFSITGGGGGGAVELEFGDPATFDLKFSAEYLDDLAVLKRPIYAVEEGSLGVYETPRDIYQGTLTVTIQRSDEGDETQLFPVASKLTFDLERPGSPDDPPRIQQFTAELPNVPFEFLPSSSAEFKVDLGQGQVGSEQSPGSLSFLSSTAPINCVHTETTKPGGILSLKPVFFKRAQQGPLPRVDTGRSMPIQCQNATTLWSGSCLQIQILGEKVVDAANLTPDKAKLMDSVNPQEIAGLWTDPDMFTVTVFFVPGLLAECGGGVTLNALTNIPTIVLTDLDPNDPDNNNLNLLAHELGHVLLSLHPVGASIKGYWKPDQGTVMEATNDSAFPNPDSNTLRNRWLACGPVVVPNGSTCTST